ncbi:hypothetical protein E4T56_gene2965 [Termitomyces sp. T112]|nr:hypothetical protein E4T56_gene2965 [Termitomyces sp. T112]
MKTVFASTVLPFISHKALAPSPAHLVALILSLVQTSSIFFTPSSPSRGDNSAISTVNVVPTTRAPSTPTTKAPTRTTPCSLVERSDMLGLYLTVGTLFIGVLFGLVTVYSRAGRKPTDQNYPPPRRNPRRGQRSVTPPPAENDPTNNNEETDNGGSDPDSSRDGGSGSGDGDGDNSNDTTDEQEADIPQSEELLRAEPNPEDPPPPPPTTLNENDDDPKVALYGPILSLLHFLLGAAAGLLTRLVTMNVTNYCQELERFLRSITFRPISLKIGFSSHVLPKLSTIETPCSCQHRPFVVATAQHHSSLRTRRIKVSLPAPFTRIFFRCITYAMTRVSRTYIYVVENIRPPVNWFIHAMASDLVVIKACISIAIDWIRVLDAEHGSSLRLIAGSTVLVLVVLEIYQGEISASPAAITNTNWNYGDDILFPFADADLPLDDFESLRSDDAHIDPPDHSEDNSDIFPFHDVDLPLVNVELDNLSPLKTPVADPIANIENDNGTMAADEAESLISGPETGAEAEQPGQASEEVFMGCMSALSSYYIDAEQAEIPETSHNIHEADSVSDEVLSSEDSHSSTVVHMIQNALSEEIAPRAPRGEDLHAEDETSIGEDPDIILECLYGLFNTVPSISKEVYASAHVLPTEDERMTNRTPSSEDSHTGDGARVEEDLDIILECLVDFFDSPMNRSSSEEQRASSFPEVLAPVSPRKSCTGVCIRAFTSCEAFAAMFGFENENPLEFLQPLPARLERLLPIYSNLSATPARYFTLGAPPATPTTPYARWVDEKHQTTPFIASPFGPPCTPPCTPPTIVIPSPTSSEGTQPPDESPAAIRARRLDRKWAKIMEKRRKNESKNIVPRVHIEETSSSSSIASDNSVKSFFDPHASVNRGTRDTEIEAGPSKLTKWRPRGPGDPVPRQKRKWRKKDVLVG